MIKNLNYLKTAVEVLEDGTSEMNQLKILKVIQQICERNIEKIENAMIDRVEGKLARNYQDQQNQRLVDILKD